MTIADTTGKSPEDAGEAARRCVWWRMAELFNSNASEDVPERQRGSSEPTSELMSHSPFKTNRASAQ